MTDAVGINYPEEISLSVTHRVLIKEKKNNETATTSSMNKIIPKS